MSSMINDAIGYAASSAVLITFIMPTIGRLRLAAIASNILFGIYGYRLGIYPVLILHALLLPINIVRLVELWSNRNLFSAPRTHVSPGGQSALLKALEHRL